MKLIILSTLLVLAGCATGTRIITGQTRPAIAMELVKVYVSTPDGATEIGIVTANASGQNQVAVDAAVTQLRYQAARLGANGVVIMSQTHSRTEVGSVGVVYGNGLIINPSTTSSQTTISAKAVFVP